MKNIFDQDNQYKKVLLYAREPYGAGNIFRERGDYIIRESLKCDNYDIISDYYESTNFYIDIRNTKIHSLTYEDYIFIEENLDIHSIIKNERVFRFGKTYDEALNLILRCSKFIIDFFAQHKYDILVVNVIDTYVLDILTTIASRVGTKVISNCGNSFSTDYAMMTLRGEYNFVRTPDVDESEAFYQLLKNKKERPFVLDKGTVYKNVIRDYVKYKVKYVYHYLYKHKLLGKLDYRYLATTTAVYPKRIRNIVLADKFMTDTIPKSKNAIYIPLHRHPECSTEYFVRNSNYLTYYNSLLKVIRYYSEQGYDIILKEHTSMIYYRDTTHYESILSIKNTWILNPFINTYDILGKCKFTVLWTGTTGVEALIAGYKVILTETDIYYNKGNLNFLGEENQLKVLSEEEKRELSDHILSCFLPLKGDPSGNQDNE